MKSFPKMCFEPGSKPGCWAACGVSTRHVSPSHQNLVPGSGSVQSTLFCPGGGDDLHLSPAISPWLCCSHLAPSDVLEVAPCFLCPCAGLWGRVPPHGPFAFARSSACCGASAPEPGWPCRGHSPAAGRSL